MLAFMLAGNMTHFAPTFTPAASGTFSFPADQAQQAMDACLVRCNYLSSNSTSTGNGKPSGSGKADPSGAAKGDKPVAKDDKPAGKVDAQPAAKDPKPANKTRAG